MDMSLGLRLPNDMYLCRSSSNILRLPSFLRTHTFGSLLTRCRIHRHCHRKQRLNVQKWSEHVVALPFWLGNVLRATAACTFFTSQLAKAVRCWGAVDIFASKCASRHDGVHFLHLNFHKCSEHEVLLTFWLQNELRATAACNFSSLMRPDGSAPAALASLLFDPPEPQNIGKTQCFATCVPFRAPWSSFCWFFLFWLFLFSDCSHHYCCVCP